MMPESSISKITIKNNQQINSILSRYVVLDKDDIEYITMLQGISLSNESNNHN